MKRSILAIAFFVVLIALPGVLFAQNLNPALTPLQSGSDTVTDKPYFAPGTISANLGVGFQFYGWGIGAYPGLELTLARPVFGDVLPISFGVAARGLIGFDFIYGGGVSVGIGGYGTAHLSLKDLNLDVPALNPLDFYIGLGIVYQITSSYWGWTGLSFSSLSGVNWFLNNNLALYVEYSYWFYSSTAFGIVIKI